MKNGLRIYATTIVRGGARCLLCQRILADDSAEPSLDAGDEVIAFVCHNCYVAYRYEPTPLSVLDFLNRPLSERHGGEA